MKSKYNIFSRTNEKQSIFLVKEISLKQLNPVFSISSFLSTSLEQPVALTLDLLSSVLILWSAVVDRCVFLAGLFIELFMFLFQTWSINKTMANSSIGTITKQRETRMYAPKQVNCDFFGLSSYYDSKYIYKYKCLINVKNPRVSQF